MAASHREAEWGSFVRRKPAGQSAENHEVADLTTLAKAGDRTALETLLGRFEASVYRICFRILNDNEQAQDARQETFVRVLQSLNRFESAGRFSTWIFSIATHVSIDMIRRRRNEPAACCPKQVDDSNQGLDECIRREDIQHTEKAMSNLEPDTRALLALRFQENLTPAQISKVLGVSANQVRVDLWRARAALRDAVHAQQNQPQAKKFMPDLRSEVNRLKNTSINKEN